MRKLVLALSMAAFATVAQAEMVAPPTPAPPPQYGQPGVTLEQATKAVLSLDGVIASDGGIPLMRDGKIIGAIGCSGALGSQDGQACKVGADTIK